MTVDRGTVDLRLADLTTGVVLWQNPASNRL